MGLFGWIGKAQAGEGALPKFGKDETPIVVRRWSRSGRYAIRALNPFDALELRFRLASMLGRELTAALFDVAVLIAGTPVGTINYRKLYAALRAYTAQNPTGLPDRKAIQDAAGELYAEAIKRLHGVMPNERELDLGDLMQTVRPYFELLGPTLGAIEPAAAMEIVRFMLLVPRDGGSGLYIAGEPVRTIEQANNLIPHEDVWPLAFWALLFNLKPFTRAASTAQPRGR
jgi:hypothetical protein